MKNVLSQIFSLGVGAAVTTKEQMEKVFEDLVAKGELSRTESKEMMEQLTEKGSQAKRDLDHRVTLLVNKTLKELNLASQNEVDALKRRIELLEQRLH